MAIVVGSGLNTWCKEHQATPLSSEVYPWPELPVSVLPIEIANSDGVKINTIVGWCNNPENPGILEPGPGIPAETPAPPDPAPPQQKTMYDSVVWQDIPEDAAVVAGYVDGLYEWPAEAWERFPSAQKVRIAVLATTNDGEVLDIEPGNATPDLAPAWIQMRIDAGVQIPTIYCSLSDVQAVKAACGNLPYDLWIAHWTGEPHMEPGAAATQYANPPSSSGGNYDLSVCEPWWPREFFGPGVDHGS